MAARTTRSLPSWTTLAPGVAILALVLTWGRDLGALPVVLVAAVLGAAVLAAVHHAEVVAHRVGEPFGSLVLAVAVTVIEVALIVTLMVSGGKDTASLARDTVFAAVMITCNGIVGPRLCWSGPSAPAHLLQRRGHRGRPRHGDDAGDALTWSLPTFTTSAPGPEFSAPQLAFAAVASLALYALFVLDPDPPAPRLLPAGRPATASLLEEDEHAEPPTDRETRCQPRLLLLVSLVAVVGLAKVVSPAIESAVAAAGFPQSFVGVVIALLVLLPETLAAVRAARRNRMQISLNLALGSAMASIGLTIPAIAVASIWLHGPLAARPGRHPDGAARPDRRGQRAHGGARPRHPAAGRCAPRAAGRLPLPRGQPLRSGARGSQPRAAYPAPSRRARARFGPPAQTAEDWPAASYWGSSAAAVMS